MKPRLLDLFSDAGGCAVGYARVGFDVTAVDLSHAPLRRNPAGQRVQANAIAVLRDGWFDLDGFDVIHASPPCQHYSITKHSHKHSHPDLLPEVRQRLNWWAEDRPGRVWVIENVPGAPMPGAVTLCGSEFGLRTTDDRDGKVVTLRRHRLFESNIPLWGAGGCSCAHDRKLGRIAGAYGGGSTDRNHAREVRRGGYTPSGAVRKRLMGVEWMTDQQCNQAIPPAYTQFIGEQIMAAIEVAA